MNFVLFSYYISSLKKRSDVASFRETEKTSLLQSSFDNNKGGNSTKLNPQQTTSRKNRVKLKKQKGTTIDGQAS